MKRISKYMAILFVGASVLTSCNLDEDPTGYINYGENEPLIPTKLELETMRNGLYTSFRSTFYGEMSEVPELMCDGFNYVYGNGNIYGPVHRLDDSFTAGDYDASYMWETHYTAIKNYNIFISEVAKYEPEDDAATATAAIADGEAHFMRAVSYLTLVRHYAKAYNASTASSDLGVPLVLVYDQNAKPARATVKEVYDQIKSDLDVASSELAGVSGKVGSQNVTIDAVNFMYARYYLDTQNYAKAAEYAMDVIQGKYEISSDLQGMLDEYFSDSGTEPIMQLPATATENGSGTNSAYLNTNYYSQAGVYYSPYFMPSQKLIDLYEKKDLRYQWWFDGYGWYANYYGINYTYISSFYSNSYGIVNFVKYFGNPDLTSNGVPNNRQHVKPFMIGEMYLIAAEAYFKEGSPMAKTVLNMLQTSRGATATAATEENIENEWFKETVGEGLRFSCLKRWGKGYNGRAGQPILEQNGLVLSGPNYTQKSLPADDYHWLFPIPSYEIKVNDNLVQNDGY